MAARNLEDCLPSLPLRRKEKKKIKVFLSPQFYDSLSIVTLHFGDRIFQMFPELRDLVYVDDETTIGRFSQVLKIPSVNKPLFNLDDNLDFNMGKTEFLGKGPTARTRLLIMNQ